MKIRDIILLQRALPYTCIPDKVRSTSGLPGLFPESMIKEGEYKIKKINKNFLKIFLKVFINIKIIQHRNFPK